METTERHRDQLTVGELFTCLTDTYGCFLAGSCPGWSAADVAHVILSGVRGVMLDAPAEYCSVNNAELTCISVTLLERMASSVMSHKYEVSLYYTEVLRVLFEDMDVMPQLVHLFQAEDLIISHLAAKCVSACVVYNLHKSGMLSPVWQKKCVQTFHSSPPGTELDTCMWSVTEVLKRLIKGSNQEFLGNHVAVFDSSLCTLCSKLLPTEGKKAAECLVSLTSRSRWGTTVCLLMDLLEVLASSKLIFGPSVSLESQRLIYIHSSAILAVISSSSENFIKKRALLLLKRAVLCKMGEDWALGEVSSGQKCDHLKLDVCVLVQSVLTAVADNWLETVQVEPYSFFGGTRQTRGDEGLKPDSVMLRAISLIILKSIELHIQAAAGAGVDNATEVYGHLQNLWGFLRRCSVQLTEVTHPCCWISLLFGEQDDDMMEAARALLSIFLNHRLFSGSGDEVAVLKAACASGCNPHCHFVLLLQSISFDHSTLLDFLISTETCFLEYFVRYLKYVRDDWQGFTAACGGISAASCYGDRSALTHKGERVKFSPCDQPTGVKPAVENFGLAAKLHLVDYDSSDSDSDPENMEVEGGASLCEKPAVVLQQKQNESSAVLSSDPNLALETGPQCHSLPVMQSKLTSCANIPLLMGQVTCQTSTRAVLCLSELREVVTRLHTKKLFPYNPSALLKLLAQVENSYQQSQR